MTEGVADQHGRYAGHPDEFRASPKSLDIFDGGLALGYFRRLEVLLKACPVDIYAASSLKHPWPYRLQNAKECYPASFWRSQNRIMDSAIAAPSLSNAAVLEHAVERFATSVVAKDYLPFDVYEALHSKGELSDEEVAAAREHRATYGDHVTATTQSIKEFADLHDESTHPPAWIPLQPPYDEHIEDVYSIVESSHLDHRYMLGGLKDASPKRRIDELLAFRSVVGNGPVAHGLGWGIDDELVAAIREEPNILDSVDNSSTSQALLNGRILDKHWRSRPFAVVDEGQYQNVTMGGFEFASLVQGVHRMTPYNEEFDELRTQSTFGEWDGAETDD